MLNKIVIVDYGVGNLFSLINALEKFGCNVNVSCNENEISESDAIVLPGVGSFNASMDFLRKNDMVDFLINQASQKKILGICLGMQLLFKRSIEFGECSGLGLLEGSCSKIPQEELCVKVPNIGWHYVESEDSSMMPEVLFGEYYFLHSYYVAGLDQSVVTAKIDYSGVSIPAFIRSNNLYGCQFHPEKSAKKGLLLLRRFVEEAL